MPIIDVTGAATLEDIRAALAEQSIQFALARMRAPARLMLRETGFEALVGADRFYPTVRTGVDALATGALQGLSAATLRV
jgi:MFS superfamily sulfate permease-like transporter